VTWTITDTDSRYYRSCIYSDLGPNWTPHKAHDGPPTGQTRYNGLMWKAGIYRRHPLV